MLEPKPPTCDLSRAYSCTQAFPTLQEVIGTAQVVIDDARSFAPNTPEEFVRLTPRQQKVLGLAGQSIEALAALRRDLPTLCGNCVLNPLVNGTIPELTKDLGK